MSIYDKLDSGIIQRGEEIFPFVSMGGKIDADGILRALSFIPFECGRYLSTDEILNFYE